MGAKLIRFSAQPFPQSRVIGKSVVQKVNIGVDDRTIQDLWAGMAADGSLDCLLAMPGRIGADGDTVGWMGDFEPGADHYTYLAGVLVAPGTPVPEGYECRDIAACDMAVGWIQSIPGPEGGDLFANASDHINQAMRDNGYEYDGAHGLFEMECYTRERFKAPQERGEPPVLDFYSPCKKAGG